MRDVYVISSCRTAVGTFGGSLRDVPAADLGATVIAEALKRGNVKGEWLDEVMFGNVLSAAQGQNVARQCMVKAGVPLKVPAYTVSMVCGSGLKSVIEGARAIQCGDADLVMCGGTESMSGAPYAIPTNRWGARMGHTQIIDTMIKDGLWDAYNNYHMGTTAENICDIWGITREELDEFGYNSQMKALAAIKSGRFEDEIVPVMVKKKKETVEFKVDEHPKDTTLEKMAKLKGAFPTSADGALDKVEMTFEATHMTPLRRQHRRAAGHRRQRLRPERRRSRHHHRLRGSCEEVRPEAPVQGGLLGPGRRRSQDHGHRPHPRFPPGSVQGRPDHRRHGPDRGQRGFCCSVHRRGP